MFLANKTLNTLSSHLQSLFGICPLTRDCSCSCLPKV